MHSTKELEEIAPIRRGNTLVYLTFAVAVELEGNSAVQWGHMWNTVQSPVFPKLMVKS